MSTTRALSASRKIACVLVGRGRGVGLVLFAPRFPVKKPGCSRRACCLPSPFPSAMRQDADVRNDGAAECVGGDCSTVACSQWGKAGSEPTSAKAGFGDPGPWRIGNDLNRRTFRPNPPLYRRVAATVGGIEMRTRLFSAQKTRILG